MTLMCSSLIERAAVAAFASLLCGLPARAATIVVDSTADIEADDGLCTLREAAASVNTDTASGASPAECVAGESGTDVVLFDLPFGSTIAATVSPFVFDQSVDIRGPGADALTIAIGGLDRVLVFDGIDEPLAFSLSGVAVSSGTAITPYENHFSATGGGLAAIQVQDLTLVDVRFVNNSAEASGGGMAIEVRLGGSALIEDCTFESNRVSSSAGGGGGGLLVLDAGLMVIRRSLFVSNEVISSGLPSGEDAAGGAILLAALAGGTLTIENSTFSNNRASGDGGAIAFGNTLAAFGPDMAAAFDSLTFVGNRADTDGDSIIASGGAIHAERSEDLITLHNSIVATNTDSSLASPPAPDIVGNTSTVLSLGANWIGVRAGAGDVFSAGQPNLNGDWAGTTGAPLDPLLEVLDDNGGATRTHRPVLAAPSPVIDAGGCPVAVEDQRGFLNPATGLRAIDDPAIANAADGCDIGAFEVGAVEAPLFEDDFESGGFGAWSSVACAPCN